MSDPVYYLEYRGTLAPDAPGGDKRTLDAWGIDAADAIVSANWDRGEGIFSTRADSPLLTELTWAAEDHIVLWRDSVRIWHGYLISPADVEDAAGRTIRLRFADAWYWLGRAPAGVPTVSAQTTEQVTYTDSQGNPYTVGVVTSVTWSTSLGSVVWPGAERVRAQAPYTASGQVYRALYSAADFYAGRAGGCPFGIGTILLTNRAPTQDLKNLTCAAWMQSAARYAVLSAGWWDQSGTQPIFHAADRAALTASTYALSPADQTHDVEPLTELQVRGVVIHYWYGDGYGEYITDSAGDTTAGSGLLSIDSDVDDYQAAVVADTAGVAAILYAALSPLAWRGTLAVSEVDGTLPALRPGYALHLSGGETAWAAMGGVIQGTTLAIPAEGPAILTVGWGAPRQLNVTDWLDISRLGTAAASSSARTDNEANPPATAPTPGTYDDLNGGTGGGTPLGSIAVQSRGAPWTLLGFSAYVGEPTRRWRLRTFSGSLTDYSGYTCYAGMAVSGAAQQAGTQYVEDDGSVTRTALVTPTAGGGLGYSAPTAIIDAYGLCGSSDGTGYCRTTTITATLVSTVGVGGGGSGCCTTDGTLYYGYAGTTIAALSAEDLPPAAIARMMATADWGEAMTAIQTIPTVGITGVYREARYRTEHTETAGTEVWVEGHYLADGTWSAGYYRTVTTTATLPTLIGLSPWQRYKVTVTLESRPVDSAGGPTGDGSWSAAGTRQHYFVANLAGEGGIDWQVVEPTAGYETRIASTLAEVA